MAKDKQLRTTQCIFSKKSRGKGGSGHGKN